MTFCIIVVYTCLYSKCDLYDNWLIDIHILLKLMHKFLPVLLTFPDWFRCDYARIALIVELKYCGLYKCS